MGQQSYLHVLLALLLPWSVASAESLRTTFNPFTGKFDYVTDVSTTSLSLSTAAITSGKFGDDRVAISTGAVVSGIFQPSMLPSTVAYTNASNTFTSSQTITDSAGLGVSAGSVTANAFFGDGNNLTNLRASSVASGVLGASVIASSVAATAVSPAAYGSATQVGTFTVGQDGRLTAAGNTPIAGTAPGGAAGGELAGTYPNPTLSGTRTGQMTITSSVTVQDNAFSVGASTLVVSGGRVGLGTTNPAVLLEAVSTSTQARLSYSGSVYTDFATNSSGHLRIRPTGNVTSFGDTGGSATPFVRFYQGPDGPAGDYGAIWSNYGALYLENNNGPVILPVASDETHAFKIQEGGGSYSKLSWWFDGASVTGTGMWIKTPTDAGSQNFKLGDAASSYSFNVADSAGTNRFRVLSGGAVVITTSSSPASSAACTAGTISWDASYIYVCTASGAWKRAALTGGY